MVTVAIFSFIPLSGWLEDRRIEKLDTVGGRVGIDNQSGHRVVIHISGHDSMGVVEREYRLQPGEQYVIQDSMSKDEVLAFPPEGFVDSAILVFDDSLTLRHGPRRFAGIYPWDACYEDHCIQDEKHWLYQPLTESRGSRYHRPRYRPVRVYILTNDDYGRAARQ